MSLSALGRLLMITNRSDEAGALFGRALDIARKSAAGPNIRIWARLLVNIGRYHRLQGRLAESQTVLQEALEILERALGADHARTLAAVTALGELYLAQGRYESAEAMYRRAVAALEKNQAQDIDRAGAMASLAAICRARGRLTEAEQLYRRALPLWESLLPAEDYAKKLRELGALYRADGRRADAREMEESARKVLERSAQASGFLPAH